MTSRIEEPKSTRVKACTECRQQKLKCDASKKGSLESCSRCGRLHLQCVVSKSFRRVKRRTYAISQLLYFVVGLLYKSKSELQAEVDSLRQRVQEGRAAENGEGRSSIHGPSPRSSDINNDAHGTNSAPSSLPHIEPESVLNINHLQDNMNQSLPIVPRAVAEAVSNLGPEATIPQTLDNLSVGAEEIDDCFKLFLRHHLQYVPVVDTCLRPNECHAQSPFLFWTIVAIGSRKYEKDPTLVLMLGPKIIQLAQRAILTREEVLTTIQALVCLCSWPMPFSTLNNDITPMLAGAMLQLAMSIGLHVYGVGQDFSRTKLQFDRWQSVQRAKLWALCLTVSQNVNIITGIPPTYIPDTYDHDCNRVEVATALSPQIRFLKELTRLHAEAILNIERNALSKIPDTKALLLDSAIDAALLSLSRLESQISEKLDEFYLICARLHILSFHLFTPKASMNDARLATLYETACNLIEVTMHLDMMQKFAEFGPMLVSRFSNLAAFVILKIGRSHVRDALDLTRGQRLYFSVIQFHKKYSVQSDDVYARATLINTQLWTSHKIFKRSDGSVDSLTLRCRSRLGMSLVYDCYWWWRQEFGGQSNPYEGINDVVRDGTATHPFTGQICSDSTNFLETGWSPQEYFPFYEWSGADLPIENWPQLTAGVDSEYQLPASLDR